MALQIGDVAPDFDAETTEGRIRFHEWLGGSWGVLDVIIAGSVSDDDVKKTYPQGGRAPRPYIRIVPQPGR